MHKSKLLICWSWIQADTLEDVQCFVPKFPKVPKFHFEIWYLNKNTGLFLPRRQKIVYFTLTVFLSPMQLNNLELYISYLWILSYLKKHLKFSHHKINLCGNKTKSSPQVMATLPPVFVDTIWSIYLITFLQGRVLFKGWSYLWAHKTME